MRIPAGRCWLVAAALVLGTVNGDVVTFSDFNLNLQGLAIYNPNGPAQTFLWNASGVTVNKINLWHANGTGLGDLVASGLRPTENDPDTPSAEPTATPTGSPQDPMVRRRQAHGMLNSGYFLDSAMQTGRRY